jgi:hypothetical protein
MACRKINLLASEKFRAFEMVDVNDGIDKVSRIISWRGHR